MGVFTIHPKKLSDVTCELAGESPYSTNYVIISDTIDWAEQERSAVVASMGGSVPYGFHAAKFTAWIAGSTPEDAIANFNTFRRALTDQNGGYVEYRPTGLGASVLTTWYWYENTATRMAAVSLQQGPVALTDFWMRKLGATGREGEYWVQAVVQLPIKTYATSDPDTLVSIKTATTLDNCDDATHTNTIKIASSSVKGDAVIPVITIAPYPMLTAHFLIHKRDIPSGGDDNNTDWYEAEDLYQGPNSSNQVDATCSGGEYDRYSDDSYISIGDALDPGVVEGLPSDDKTLLGHLAPFVCAKVSTGGSWTLYLNMYLIGYALTYYTSSTITIDEDDWQVYYDFETLEWPPIPIPSRMDDDDIDDYLKQFRFDLNIERTAGTIDFDWVLLPKADDFIAVFDRTYFGSGGNPTDVVIIDAIERSIVNKRDSPLYIRDPWTKTGSDWGSLVFRSGYDSKLRFVGWYDSDTDGYDATDQFSVTIQGIYATVYPFSET